MRQALATLLKLPAGASISEQWVSCDGEGRVTTIWLKKRSETLAMALHGVKFGIPEKDVGPMLGAPWKTGKGWSSFAFGNRRLRLGFKDNVVASMTLFIEG